MSLSNLVVENHTATVLYHTAYNPYFRTNAKLFSATDFIAELLQQVAAYCRSSVPPVLGARQVHEVHAGHGSNLSCTNTLMLTTPTAPS